MRERVLIVKNITREGPGVAGCLLSEKGIGFYVLDLDKGENFPDIKEYRALVVLGGPDSANDTGDKIRKELDYIREALLKGVPYLGICLGLQLLVKAAGGRVVKSPVREIGFIDPEGNNFTVELTEEGKRDPLFNGLRDRFRVFHLHGETVELRDNMTLLGVGKFCRNQIVRVGTNAYGIQCHFELTKDMLDAWCEEDPDLRKMKGDVLISQFNVIEDQYIKDARRLFKNFLKISGV